jgi:hypothetical protein
MKYIHHLDKIPLLNTSSCCFIVIELPLWRKLFLKYPFHMLALYISLSPHSVTFNYKKAPTNGKVIKRTGTRIRVEIDGTGELVWSEVKEVTHIADGGDGGAAADKQGEEVAAAEAATAAQKRADEEAAALAKKKADEEAAAAQKGLMKRLLH